MDSTVNLLTTRDKNGGHVDDHCSDDEYEETLVLVKFEDFSDVSFFNESNKIEITNIADSCPKCNVDNFTFSGKYSINLGTLLFFEKANLPGEQMDVALAGSTSTTLEFSLRSIPSSSVSQN